jgi:tetratricopeptide (TPR) repeat protein
MVDQGTLQNEIDEAISFFSNNEFLEAIAKLNSIIDIYPENEVLYNILGACYVGLEQLDKGVYFYNKALEVNPNYSKAYYNLGSVLYDLSRIDEALECYRLSLKIDPTSAETHNNLGIILVKIGEIEEASKCFKRALKINPNYFEARYSLAIQQQIQGNEESLENFKKIIAIKPNFAEAYNRIGIILYQTGQDNESINAFRRAVELEPNFAEAYNNLGNVLKNQRNYDEALGYFDKALALNPMFAEAYNNRGNTFKELQQLDNAVQSYNRAVTLEPNYYEAYFNLGLAYEDLGDSKDAVKSYEKALNINPNYVDALNNLGNVYIELGFKNNAINCYERAIALQPNFANVHRNLSTLKKYKEGDPQIAQMQLLFAKNDLSISDRTNLCFALSKVYKDLQMNDELFEVLDEGNNLRKKELNYSFDKDSIRHSFYKDSFKDFDGKINNIDIKPLKIKPIFIVGMPRSGTSLVEQIISSHSKVFGAGELEFLIKAIAPIVDDCIMKKCLLSGTEFSAIREKYFNGVAKLSIQEKIITDKMPTNFEYIGFILNAIPEAKIIHLKRDPMATCWSIYSHYFPSGGFDFAYSMNDIAHFYNSYIELMDSWHKLFPQKIYDVNYEFLTSNQEDETRKILAYCELEWENDCLNFQNNERSSKTASVLQVKKGIYQGSSETWKKYDTFLETLMHKLNYYKKT